MSVPDRPSTEIQTQVGTTPVPAYETPLYRIGRGSLSLIKAIDDLAPEDLSRTSNMRSVYGSALEVRPGQTASGTTTGSELIHSLFRLNDPGGSNYARFAGSSTKLYRGTTGAYSNVDSSYSGDPLTFTGVPMPLAGTPYVIVSDRSRQRKFSRTGSVEVFGIPPAGAVTTAVASPSAKTIATMLAGDGSAAANWTPTAGTDRSAVPNASGVPVIADVPAIGIQVTTVVGAAATGYYSLIGLARTLNLNYLDAGNTIAASDLDQILLSFNVDQPQYLEELKIYYVINAGFVVNAVPGMGGSNTDAWFKSFRPNELQAYFEQQLSGLDAGDDLRLRTLIEQFKTDQVGDDRASLINRTGALDLNRQDILQIPAGRNVWGEFGVAGNPLRRGDYQRVGQQYNGTVGWNTVTGIIIAIQTNAPQPVVIQLTQEILYGGSGPDNSDVGASGYDVRCTNYNPLTGSEGNPSSIQAATAFLNAVRSAITVTPTASGTAALRQKAYMRGGDAAATQDWFYAGISASDGGTISITDSDDTRTAAATLAIDNDQPVTSVNSSGATVLNQTLPIYFMVEDFCFGLGDSNQPGRLYRSKQGAVEQWPATSYIDVCASNDELMCGGAVASAGFCFSRSRLYSILLGADGSWTTEPTQCNEGPASRWAMAVTPFGIGFVSPFGVRLTTGGIPERLSDAWIEPLFRGETVRGLSPIDFSVPTALQLAYFDDELWLSYQDTGGTRHQLIYNFFSKNWRLYTFGTSVATVYGEYVSGAAAGLLLGSTASGAIYTHDGFSDLGSAIAYAARTGAWDFGDPSLEKLLSQIVVDAEISTGSLTVQAFLNDELTSVTSQSVTGLAGLRRYQFEPFGTAPQRARNVSVQISGNASTSLRPYFNLLGVTRMLQPAITFNEPTPWEELPGGEGYVWGCLITCDTGDTGRSMVVEYTSNNGSITTAATITVQASARRKLPFSWTPVLAQQIRLRPTGSCEPWIRYKIEWLSDPEPPRIKGWDTNWESFGTYADKWIKGYLIEADTFNVAKTVVLDSVDSDGVQNLAVNTLSLTRNGRGIYQQSFAKIRGRLFRLRATDSNFGKFFRWQPMFDEEPLALTRWESEEVPFQGMAGRWQKPLEAFVTLRSSGTVTWQVVTYGASGATLDTSSYTIPTTGGVKAKVRVPMNAVKGLLFSHLFTASAAFWLYKEESEVQVEDWASGQAAWVPLPVANDDLAPARQMGNSVVAASTPGGA